MGKLFLTQYLGWNLMRLTQLTHTTGLYREFDKAHLPKEPHAL